MMQESLDGEEWIHIKKVDFQDKMVKHFNKGYKIGESRGYWIGYKEAKQEE